MGAGDDAADVLRLAEADPRKTAGVATTIRDRAHAAHDWGTESVAAGIPAATALAGTQHRLAAEDPAAMATAAAFICIGGEYTRASA